MRIISKIKQAIMNTDTVMKSSGKVTFNREIEFDKIRFYYESEGAEDFEMRTTPNRSHQQASCNNFKILPFRELEY